MSDDLDSVLAGLIETQLDRMVNPNLPAHLICVADALHDIASDEAAKSGPDPDVLRGIEKLVEAKDCFIRARVAKKASV